MTVVTAYMQTQGTTSGAFFDKDSMKTLFHGEGFLEATREKAKERDQEAEVRMLSRSRVRTLGALRTCALAARASRSRVSEAIRTYAETLKYTMNADGSPREPGQAPYDGVSLMGSVLPNQVSGRCALIYDWMASGTSSVLEGPWFGISYVNNQVRSTLVGTSHVQDSATQKLVTCTAEQCPYATQIGDELVNMAPYMAAGGLAAGINEKATEEGQQLALDFFQFMSVNSASFVNQQTVPRAVRAQPGARSRLQTCAAGVNGEQPADGPSVYVFGRAHGCPPGVPVNPPT